MWRYFRGVLIFLLLLGFLPLAAVFLLKLLVLAGTWTLESITEPMYAITAGITFLLVLAIGILLLFELSRASSRTSPGALGAPGRPTAYCNACGKLNWADVLNCHYCRAQMPTPSTN
jgi:hypothetical protein